MIIFRNFWPKTTSVIVFHHIIPQVDLGVLYFMQTDQIFLETSRLLIKIPSLEDFDAICELNANPEVMRYIEICRPQPKVREFLEKAINHFKKHGFSFGTVIEKSSNKIIGQAGILIPSQKK